MFTNVTVSTGLATVILEDMQAHYNRGMAPTVYLAVHQASDPVGWGLLQESGEDCDVAIQFLQWCKTLLPMPAPAVPDEEWEVPVSTPSPADEELAYIQEVLDSLPPWSVSVEAPAVPSIEDADTVLGTAPLPKVVNPRKGKTKAKGFGTPKATTNTKVALQPGPTWAPPKAPLPKPTRPTLPTPTKGKGVKHNPLPAPSRKAVPLALQRGPRPTKKG